MHTENSLLDSCTNYKLYVDRAVELGQKAIAFTEHGNTYNNIEKKMYANKNGLKYLHGVEIYLTETLNEKIRDNYHTILIAKNYEGVKEINLLVDKSTRDDHAYYKPRISFDEFLQISDNVIKISACLASPLNKYPSSVNKAYEDIQVLEQEKPDGFEQQIELLKVRIQNAKHVYEQLLQKYDYYEIQPHVNSLDQLKYNQMLYEASKLYNKPLIAGTDTHSINKYKAECRSILQKAKRIEFANEDEFDLTYKSYDELVEMFRQQGSLPMEVVLEAIENTNRMADSVEDFELDTEFKYPKLYDNEEEVFIERIYRMYNEKLEKGIIQPDPRYEENIKEELRVFKKIGMIGFMLFMSELVCWCWDNDIPVGYCRGSVGGSTIAYLTDIIDVNPIVWNTVFSRFANEDRKEIGDIDIDLPPSKRHLVYEHIIEEFGEDFTAYVLAIGTVSDKGTIDEIGRALNIPLDEVKEIKSMYSEYTDAISDAKDKIKKIESSDNFEKIKHIDFKKIAKSHRHYNLLSEYEDCKNKLATNEKKLKELKTVKYSDLFYYFDGLVNTAISQSMHPAGIIVSPVSLPDNYGTFWAKDGKRILSINMEEIHEVSLVKYDLLGLKNIEIIDDCCKLAGIPYPKSHTLNWLDKKVWEHISDSPVGIFQFESSFAFDSMKKFKCQCVNDLSLVNASIRPSGESYRDRLLSHEENKNPSEIIDDLLAANHGFLVFQEDVIAFLQKICGMSGSDADNTRRAIARKQMDRLQKALPEILEGYCRMSPKSRNQAEEEATVFLKIIEDASSYMFGYNHSTGYSMIGYTCGYLRHYYPNEFITAYLNNANNDDDITQGTALAKQYQIPMHSIKFRHSGSKYTCDKNGIYKGISSIKFLNEEAASDLYSIKDETFESFIDLLVRIGDLKVDSRKLEILIKLNFFEEFGNIEKLLLSNDLFNKYYGKKQLKKEKLFEEQLDFDVVRRHAGKETPKMLTQLDSVGLVNELVRMIPEKQTSLKTIVHYQIENLGYIEIVDKQFAGICVVTDINVEYSPKLKLYALANGNTIPVKIDKKTYARQPLKRGDIVKVIDQYRKNKMKKVDGKWVESDEKEWWIREYKVC